MNNSRRGSGGFYRRGIIAMLLSGLVLIIIGRFFLSPPDAEQVQAPESSAPASAAVSTPPDQPIEAPTVTPLDTPEEEALNRQVERFVTEYYGVRYDRDATTVAQRLTGLATPDFIEGAALGIDTTTRTGEQLEAEKTITEVTVTSINSVFIDPTLVEARVTMTLSTQSIEPYDQSATLTVVKTEEGWQVAEVLT